MRHAATALAAACVWSAAAQDTAAPSTAHDGRWSVTLVCEDVRSEKGGLAKGYTLVFPVQVSGGKLEGGYRSPGAGGEVRYVGTVGAGGELFVRAVGATGKSEYTVHQVAQGTPYGYTLRGQLGASDGQARRLELRPCTAQFARAP